MNQFNPADLTALAPLMLFAVGGLLLVLAEAFAVGRDRDFLMKLTIATSAFTGMAAIYVWRRLGDGTETVFGGMLQVDAMACLACVIFAGAVAVTAVSARAHQKEHGWVNGELYGLMLLGATGMTTLAMAGDLVTVFIGVEAMSLAAYVMIALRRQGLGGSEGAIKYFLMGAFATGFLLYGIALIYGAVGSTAFTDIKSYLVQHSNDPLVVVGMLLLVVAFAFKVAAVPFDMWAPDAYEGAPPPVTGFMASAVKAAAFIGMIRIFGDTFGGSIMPVGPTGWATAFAILAAITMTVANVAALRQENVKRMLAYSSVAHAGLLLIGMAALGYDSAGTARVALLYYLVAYSATTLGVFAIVSWINAKGCDCSNISEWAGLSAKYPAAALAMTICLLSLGGMPPTGGFFAKFYVLKAGMEAGDQALLWLVAIGAVNSVVSIFYYLRLVMTMYFREPVEEFAPSRSGGIVLVVTIAAALVLQMGLMPGWWLGILGG